MPTGYQIKDQSAPHYLTFQLVYWIDLFLRQGQDLYALYKVSDTSYKSMGKITLLTYELKTLDMVIVPLEGVSYNFGDVQTELNKIYGPLGIEWRVKTDSVFRSMEWDLNENKTLDAEESQSFSMYSPEMRALNRLYKEQRGVDSKTMYMFVVKEINGKRGGLLGDMPLSSQFGYLAASNDVKLAAKTIAHELGHGMFYLRHTFSQYNLEEGSTDNLMDYSPGTQLFKKQWDEIFDPRRPWFAWRQDEEEGAMGPFPNKALVRRILEKLRYSYVNSQRYFLTKEESGNNYCYNIKLSDGNTYSFVSVNNNHKQWSIMPNICIVNNSNTIINYVPQDEAGIPFSVRAGDFTVRIVDPKNTNFISYMRPDAAKWQSQVNSLKSEINNETNRGKFIELMYALPEELYSTLSFDYRRNYLKRLSEGPLNEGMLNRINEEKMAIQLISSTPNDQIVHLVDFLNSDRAMSDLCKGIDNIGGEENFTLFTNHLFKLYLQKYSSLLSTNYFLPDNRVFQWMDKGLIDKITYKVNYHSNNEIAFSWKYRKNYYTNPIKVLPFEVIAVNFVTDANFIKIPSEQRVVFMPAFVFAWMINEDNNLDTELKLGIALKIAEFAFAYYQVRTITHATSTLIKTLRYINIARTSTDLILLSDAVRTEINTLSGGPNFLAAYDKINDVWEIADFTINWFSGNIEYFTVFTKAWDTMVDSNMGIDVTTKYPEFYKLVNHVKEGLN